MKRYKRLFEEVRKLSDEEFTKLLKVGLEYIDHSSGNMGEYVFKITKITPQKINRDQLVTLKLKNNEKIQKWIKVIPIAKIKLKQRFISGSAYEKI